MSRFVRASSYRHVYGSPAKREKTYDNIRVSSSAWDTNLLAVNPQFLAVNYQSSGGGAFLVALLSRTGKLPDIYPLCRAHTAPVLDTAWSPFNDYIIASAGEDARVAITKINPDLLEAAWLPDSNEVQDLDPITRFSGHQRKCGHVVWHPTAENVLASAALDMKLWDVEKEQARIEMAPQPDMVQSLDFDWTGSVIATTCKDKKLRLYDPRASTSPVTVTDSHAGIKGSRVCWMGSLDRIATTGFSKLSDRQVFVWDSRAVQKGPVKSLTVDTSSGTLMPFWGEGNNILYLAGKGDGNIRYYEYENDDLYYLSEYKSTDPQRGLTFMPRRGLHVGECEIARAFKSSGSLVEPISFIVPRKSDAFQADIYPPAASAKPALNSQAYFDGKTSSPILVDLETQDLGAAPPPVKHVPAPTPAAPAPAPAAAPEPIRQPTAPIVETVQPVQPREPTPPREPTLPSAPVGGDNPQAQGLAAENARLKGELSERDHLIRNLELQLEHMKTNQRKAAEALLNA